MVSTILLFALCFSDGYAREPAAPDVFQVGMYGDDGRDIICVTGAAGATFDQMVWAWIPDDLGLAYITLRFSFPANLQLNGRPVFHDQVFDVIYTDYVSNTVEWNMLFNGCPSGWVKVFTQACTLLNGQPSLVEIQADHSMMRDCTFVLNDVVVLNELVLNDPECATVQAGAMAWSSVKSIYR